LADELTVPRTESGKVASVLSSVPGVQFTRDTGLMFTTFKVSGPPEAMAQLQPKLREWNEDYVSRSAW
jgi:hypothetical protein